MHKYLQMGCMNKMKPEIITIRKNGKKFLVIKKFQNGNAATKYGFTSDGQRKKGKLMTRDEADALIDKIIQNLPNSGVEILGDVTANTMLQELKTHGKIKL